MKPLPKQYDHKQAEKKWQQAWEHAGVYAWDESQPRSNTYVIDTPPPTVSGLLHMGHIFSYTQADFLARYQRMSGKTVFYPMGFDDNGLPTERLVEKTIKKRATDMSREAFIVECEKVAEEARKEFRRLFESVALSVDWRQEYSTISDDSRRISQMSFLDLFTKDKAYRKLQPMFWDPVDQTAIAQAEIEDKELPSSFNDIAFGVDGSDEKIIIATTRPELIPACVAVFYHPDDKRYQHLKGKQAITALFGVKVPILADEDVQMEKGTGLVMCCTFGDETDIKWWRKHNLPTRLLLDKYGKIRFGKHDGKVEFLGCDSYLDSSNTVNIAEAIKHLTAIEAKKVSNPDPKNQGAREVIIELLKNTPFSPRHCERSEAIHAASQQAEALNGSPRPLQGLAMTSLLVKQTPITHAVKCAERSGAPLEILPTYQWFVKILDQKEELKAKAAQCNWHPSYMKVRMDQWIDGLSWDWCISRQRYFGVPFPIWYSKRAGEEGKILIPTKDQLPVNPLVDLPKGYTKDEVIPEADVMDTWATSSISPQLNSKAISKDYAVDYARHQKLFPADLRPQAHEIIRTWAFYTVVKAHLHENTIPWKNLMISGWCLAADKTKMSKSKGNVVTPVDLIEEKGADVVRFWASTSKLGSDTAYSEDVLKIGRKLVTKLWNATQFASIHLEKLNSTPKSAQSDVDAGIITETLDLWVLTRLKRAITKATEEFERYEYSNARAAAEDFFWNDFCDNYLELVKVRVYGEAEGVTKAAQMSAVHTIYHCLDGILRLFAPIVPHITEELYSHIFEAKLAQLGGSIHASGTWLKAADYPEHKEAEIAGIACVSILNSVRKMKAERNVSIKWPLNFITITTPDAAKTLGALVKDLKNVTNASDVVFTERQTQDGQGMTFNTDDGKFTVTAEFALQSDAA